MKTEELKTETSPTIPPPQAESLAVEATDSENGEVALISLMDVPGEMNALQETIDRLTRELSETQAAMETLNDAYKASCDESSSLARELQTANEQIEEATKLLLICGVQMEAARMLIVNLLDGEVNGYESYLVRDSLVHHQGLITDFLNKRSALAAFKQSLNEKGKAE